jgi:hypothetical protein
MTRTDSADKPKRSVTRLGSRKRAARENETERRPKVPDRKEIEELLFDFNFTKKQLDILEYAMCDCLIKLDLYDRLLPQQEANREEIVDFMRKFANQINKLQTFLEGKHDVFKRLTASLELDGFGELLSITGIRQVLGNDAIPNDPEGLKFYLEHKGLPFDIAPAEEYYAGLRRDQALLRGHALFIHLISLFGDPLQSWLALNAANRGGRPKDARRRYVIERLYDASPKILGAYPPISITSRFADLCARALPAYGFSGKGINKLVVSVVRKKRKRATTTTSGSSA